MEENVNQSVDCLPATESTDEQPIGQTLNSSTNSDDKTDIGENQPNHSIDSSKIFVISFGSLFLRIGRASDSSPKTIYNVIARRNRSNDLESIHESYLMPTNVITKDMNKILIESQNSVQTVLNSYQTVSGRLRTVPNKDVMTEFNKRSKPLVLSKSDKQWTQIEPNDDIIVGEDVLYMKECQAFHIRWPIRRGRLNVSTSLCGSLTCVISDLQSICSKVIERHFEIPLKELSSYKVVLIIPDVYNRNHIKYLIEMLLNGLNFESCIVIHEAVCATFGAGLSHACVVDVGDQKTSICCIEDGFGTRNTRLTLDYGGSDITQLFHYLLKQRGFPFECKSDTRTGALFLQELKHKFCHLNADICGHIEKHFRVSLPEQPVLDYKILVSDECVCAPFGLFFPEMFALTLSPGKRMRILSRNEGHSDDPFDETYLIQTKRKYGETNEGSGQTIGEPNTEPVIEDELDACETINDREINIIVDQHLLGIDQAIIQCIEHCDSDELKKRMYSSVLLVGGGLAFNRIDKWLQSRLTAQIPIQFRGTPIDVIVKPKDMDSQIVSWKGAAVMSLLDSAQEMWITSEEWRKTGIRLLREKASFVF